MAADIYKKPILFAIVSVLVILIGTIVTLFLPMMTEQMHPKLENLKPFTALELAGRDIYQREGCNNCHTQTVRPLKTEVMRYGEYSKAGEFAYDFPFLWGSKRTGPDLARIGGKYPDAWHERHFEDPRKFFAKSNMPSYAWLTNIKLDAQDIKSHMDTLNFPYTDDEIEKLNGQTEMDALVAYMQILGTAVKKKSPAASTGTPVEIELENPLAGKPEAIARGKELYEENCAMCHGDNGEGDIGPSLTDNVFLYVEGDLKDDDYYEIINNGTEEGMVEEGRTAQGGMPPFGDELQKDEIWSLVTFIRSIQGKK
ncbi:MAG: cytochrome-c oxidase, cbb3-type subunit II [Nitrospiraceae bacterium]|nr:MAG: cytochrome-c oxidase, cbb3-type subunit II [Nitrospiraceae bacterium]